MTSVENEWSELYHKVQRRKIHTIWKNSTTYLTLWPIRYNQMPPWILEKLHIRDYCLDEYTILPHYLNCKFGYDHYKKVHDFIQFIMTPNLFGDK